MLPNKIHPVSPSLDFTQLENWVALLKAAHQLLHGAATGKSTPSSNLQEAKVYVLMISQEASFSEEVRHLRAGKPMSPRSKLRQLAPEMDRESGLVRVGGRLRRVEGDPIVVHPVVLDPSHVVIRLLIRVADARLLHSGPGRVYAELRRQY